MNMKFNTIILVDDEAAHATLVERNLRRVGFEQDIVKLERGQALLDLIFGLFSFRYSHFASFMLTISSIIMNKHNKCN